MQLTGKIAQGSLKDLDKGHISAGGIKVPRVWLVAADEQIAKIFRKDGEHLEFLGEAVPEVIPAGLTNKSVGRVASSGGSSIHHKYEPHSGAGQHQQITFAQKLAAWLDTAAHEDAFDRLVLIAPPRTLGNLRKVLGKPVRARIVAEVNKELARQSETALRDELAKIVLF